MEAVEIFGVAVAVVVGVIIVGGLMCYCLDARSKRERTQPPGLSNPAFKGRGLASERLTTADVHHNQPTEDGTNTDNGSLGTGTTDSGGVTYDRAGGVGDGKGEYANTSDANGVHDGDEDGEEESGPEGMAHGDVDDPNVYKMAGARSASRSASRTSATSNPPGYEAPPTFDPLPTTTTTTTALTGTTGPTGGGTTAMVDKM
eukprot:m.51055 g.51055  ORF g.51055 m.51055 type:complete len:202 (+) comp7283_c0_seq1:362-967(+)